MSYGLWAALAVAAKRATMVQDERYGARWNGDMDRALIVAPRPSWRELDNMQDSCR